MTETDARAVYERGRDAHRRTAEHFDRRGRSLAGARLAAAALALAILGGLVWGRWAALGWLGLAATAIAFVALVVVHARVDEAKDRALAAARFHERGLARLALAWGDLPDTSARYRSADHPFVADLDVFGRASLMQAVDTTETRLGENRLAALLALVDCPEWPSDVSARAEAARDLAPRVEFREAVATAAGVFAGEKADPAGLVAWAEEAGPPIAPWLRAIAWLLPASVLAIAAFGGLVGVPGGARTGAVIATMAVGLALGARFDALLSAASARESAATRWHATLAAIERESFRAPVLAALRDRLTGGGRTASQEVAALERIVGFTDARRNDVFRLFIGSFLLWDVHCAMALGRWRARAGRHLRGWLDAVGEVEALASLGAFAFEHPGFAWPELALDPTFEASGLGHPLIPEDRRVGNDVRLEGAGRAWVVTGSNMSGKSTLLRAMGVNAVLAAAGAPVCARRMRIGPLRVATSMRVEDSLSGGVSHFYAELLRLKRIVDLARSPSRAAVFFLLDEILHGTNSRERVAGAAGVVRDLLAHGALGAVSTHDLGIAALERDLAGRIENVHFEEQVDGSTMTFDYVLRPGIVQSSNALRLMRALGLAVDPPS
jgi:hypothetical protein